MTAATRAWPFKLKMLAMIMRLEKLVLGHRDTCSYMLTVLVFLKPIADMLWRYSVLDMVLTAFAILLALFLLCSRDVRLGGADLAVVVLMLLVFRSFINDTSGFETFVKMETAFLLYIVGRLAFADIHLAIKSLLAALLICVAVNLVFFLAGSGYQLWGNAYTFCGTYYFKTDLACAMMLALISALYWLRKSWLKVAVVVICGVLIFESNTRAYWLIGGLVLLLYLFYWRGCRINFGIVIGIIAGIIVALEAINAISAAGLLGNGFIGIRFNSLSDLLDSSNTQGRNVIWQALLSQMSNAPIVDRLFGIDLVGDQVHVGGSSYGSHSLYIGLLFNTGIVGLAVFIIMVVYVFKSIAIVQRDEGEEKTSYFLVSVLVMFLFSGISVHVLQYTANSWMAMMFFGMVLSLAHARNDSPRRVPQTMEQATQYSIREAEHD